MNRVAERRFHPAVLIVGGALAVDALMLATDMGPDLIAVTILGLLVGTAIWFMSDVGPTAVRPHPATAGARPLEQRADLRITTLRQALAYGASDHYLAERVHTSLVDVIDDELRVTHGIDRATDPDAAAAVLGAELTAFVADPDAATTMTARSLARIVTLIEEI